MMGAVVVLVNVLVCVFVWIGCVLVNDCVVEGRVMDLSYVCVVMIDVFPDIFGVSGESKDGNGTRAVNGGC